VTPCPEITFQVEVNIMAAKIAEPSGVVSAYQRGIFMMKKNVEMAK
jgi:Leu/Phe-tRNA-protein transferase